MARLKRGKRKIIKLLKLFKKSKITLIYKVNTLESKYEYLESLTKDKVFEELLEIIKNKSLNDSASKDNQMLRQKVKDLKARNMNLEFLLKNKQSNKEKKKR